MGGNQCEFYRLKFDKATAERGLGDPECLGRACIVCLSLQGVQHEPLYTFVGYLSSNYSEVCINAGLNGTVALILCQQYQHGDKNHSEYRIQKQASEGWQRDHRADLHVPLSD